MEDLSLHILDIVENSVKAGAKNVEILIMFAKENRTLILEIKDDGKGIDKDEIEKVFDPFYTTNKNKKTGLGLALLKDSAVKTEGRVDVYSERNKGTKIIAHFNTTHPDMIPLGDLSETMLVLSVANQDVRIKLQHSYNGNDFKFDTEELKNHDDDTLGFLKKVKSRLEDYKKFLETIKGDLYGI